MRKLCAALLACAFCLCAADFWQSKPFAEWSDKDLQKMIGNSPWARPFSVSLSGPTPPSVGGAAAGNAGTDPEAARPISENSGGGRGGRGGGGGAAPAGAIGGDVSSNVVARWQSALPIKQAFVRLKYGAEAATSPDAKQMLEREETSYVIVLSGPLRAFMRGDLDAAKKSIVDMSSLSVKGKDALKPAQLQISPGQRSIDMGFIFPRSAPFTLDDKEVEFSTKIGDVLLKYKFRLKDMVYNGKLEL
jgi:hypothetical protein